MTSLVFYYPQGHQRHSETGHPERPERVEVVRRTLIEAVLWDQYSKVTPLVLPVEFLYSVHSPRYLGSLKAVCEAGDHLDEDTYTTCESWQLALNAAGGTAAVAEAVWRTENISQGDQKLCGFALSRPPGHHAERDRGMGFCLMNNIAIAAQFLISYPLSGINNAKRVAIVDLDLHHGNGTQNIFYDREDVLYISTHQSPLYPGTGSLTELGAGSGLGYTLNLPFPPGTGDNGYQTAMEEIILPKLEQFKPEIILVSAGFDPHWRDPLGHLQLSASGYGMLIKSLVGWADRYCQSRILLVMEGGYDLMATSACALASVNALLGLPFQDTVGPAPRPEGKSWQAVIRQAKEIWQV